MSKYDLMLDFLLMVCTKILSLIFKKTKRHLKKKNIPSNINKNEALHQTNLGLLTSH